MRMPTDLPTSSGNKQDIRIGRVSGCLPSSGPGVKFPDEASGVRSVDGPVPASPCYGGVNRSTVVAIWIGRSWR
jgi:hypothetical protein